VTVVVAAAVALGVLSVKIYNSIQEAREFDRALEDNIKTMPGLTQAHKDLGLASANNAEAMSYLGMRLDTLHLTMEDQKTVIGEVTEAWALSGANTREEWDSVTENVLKNWREMKKGTAEALYGGDLCIVAQNYTAWQQISTDVAVKMDEAKTSSNEKWDLIKQKFSEIPSAASTNLVDLAAKVGERFGMAYNEALHWAQAIKDLDLNPTSGGAASDYNYLPNYGGNAVGGIDINNITELQGVVPGFASGGFVPARAGGTLVRVGEGGEDEWIVPRSKATQRQIGPITVNIYGQGTAAGEAAGDALVRRLAAAGVRL
jgi:hypothetical protein